MFHLYLLISCVSSWSFPAALSVLVFLVPMVMLSLPRIFDDAQVVYLTPPSWCTAEGAVLVNLGGDWCSMVRLHVSSFGESRAKYNLTGPIPLQVEHVTVELIVEPFRPFALFFQVCRYPSSDVVVTPAISPITGRLVEGGSVLFLSVQVHRTCPPPPPTPNTHTHAHTCTKNISEGLSQSVKSGIA